MDIRRLVLYAALALVAYSLWTTWQIEHPPVVQSNTLPPSKVTSERMLPDMATPETKGQSLMPPEELTENPQVSVQQPIHVKTDVLDLFIDPEHGDVVYANLLEYPESVDQKNKPFTLLQNIKGERYVADSSLFVVNGQKIETIDAHFTSSQQQYQLPSTQDQLTVRLTGTTADGLTITKAFVFKKGSYLIDVNYKIKNESDKTWKGYMNTQFLRSSPREDKSSMFHVGSFTGASYSQPGQHRYEKITFKDMGKKPLDAESEGGWIAMQQHYFLTAWVPTAQSKNRFYTRTYDDDYTIGAVSQPIMISPAQEQQVGARLYLGPEITEQLKEIAPGLDLTIDYGWLWFLSSLLFSLMSTIYSFIGNWGWSIVLVTVLIKLAFYRLSATSYKSMAGMRKLQPKLQALRERYGDDKAKISQATMEMYRQEKVNPLGGCLPIVIQIPVFIALYWVLLESVALRQAPFMFWINDLASADPYHVLPVIMGATMLIQQRLNPAPPDPMQAKVMMFLPILFTGLFWNFPAGLVLYWIVNNSLSILQQWYITRKYGDDQEKSPKKLATVK